MIIKQTKKLNVNQSLVGETVSLTRNRVFSRRTDEGFSMLGLLWNGLK